MKSRKARLSGSRLYVVIDRSAVRGDLSRLALSVCGKGADIIQLRDKESSKRDIFQQAQQLAEVARKTGTLFIVNDHLDIAKISGADGVHLGQDDLPVACARSILGKDRIIGVSCHSLTQALSAQKDGADYIGIGPVFATATKPDVRPVGTGLIEKIRGRIRIPFFAIGGIDRETLPQVISCGASRAAVVRAVCSARDPSAAASALRSVLR